MTISATSNRKSYAGNDGTTLFAFPYKFLVDSDLVVLLVNDTTGVSVTQTITTNYTVSGAGTDSSGQVTMLTPPATGETLIIYSDPAISQLTDYVDNSALPAESLEDSLDRLTLIARRLEDLNLRSVKQPDGDSADIGSLPTKVDRASTYLAFDADGDPIATAGTTSAVVISTFAETLLDDTTATQMQDTLALGNADTPTFGAITITGDITALGGSVVFPATQVPSADANTLDDYEERTWIPALEDQSHDGGAGEGQTYAATGQVGRYTKIGRVVFIQGYLEVTSIGTLTAGDTAFIAGLPFASANVSNLYGGINVHTASSLNITLGHSVSGQINPNVSYVTLSAWDAAGGTTALLVSEFSAGGSIAFTGQYTV